MPVDRPISPSELMQRLAALSPRVASRLGMVGSKGEAAVLVVNGRLLSRGDLVEPGQEVRLLAAAAEG